MSKIDQNENANNYFVVKLRTRSPHGSEGFAQTEDVVTDHPVFSYFVRPCVAEFIGTMFATFICSMAFLAPAESQLLRPLSIGLANGSSMALLMISFGHISGGHFNPAISLGVWLSGGMKFVILLFYLICQFFGAFIGALLVRAVLSRDVYLSIFGGLTDIDVAVGTKGQAILCELLLTYLLVQTFILTVVDSNGTNQLAPAAMLFVLTANTIASFVLTQASFNPARSFATAIAYSIFSDGSWEYHYVYWAGPFIGAMIAALVYALLLGDGLHRRILKSTSS